MHYGSYAPLFWRILNTLGADNLPAKPSGVNDDMVTYSEVKQISDGQTWSGWTPIVEAMECAYGTMSPSSTASDPEISVTAGPEISEGGRVTFGITAHPTPTADLTVTVKVSHIGNFGVTASTRTITVPTSGGYVLTLATLDDNVDEDDGSVTVSVKGGTGYTVSSAATATVTVSDDDDISSQIDSEPVACDTADAIKKARDAFEWHTQNGSNAPMFWRILNTLGADNMPSKPSNVTVETITAKEVKDFGAGKNWDAWTPIAEALKCVEDAP